MLTKSALWTGYPIAIKHQPLPNWSPSKAEDLMSFSYNSPPFTFSIIFTDGGFFESGAFKVAPAFDTESLEKLFAHKVLNMLLRKGKISEEVIKLILSWRHSGFIRPLAGSTSTAALGFDLATMKRWRT